MDRQDQRRAPSPRTSGIPSPTAPGSLAVYDDGHVFLGTVVEHDHSYFSFDVADVLVGEFETMRAAMRAVPTVKSAPDQTN